MAAASLDAARRTAAAIRQRALPGGLRSEQGFGLVELLIAMGVLSIAISALLASFASTSLSFRRASIVGTATSLANRQMEAYRGVAFSDIRIDATLIPGALDPYVTGSQADASLPSASGQAVAGSNGDTACGSPKPAVCLPVQLVTGPDGRAYRVDSYVTYANNDGSLSARDAASGLSLKRVTVVVRDGALLSSVLARASSAFQRDE